jgi:hypothetical protein
MGSRYAEESFPTVKKYAAQEKRLLESAADHIPGSAALPTQLATCFHNVQLHQQGGSAAAHNQEHTIQATAAC